jgi:hypothetical protein
MQAQIGSHLFGNDLIDPGMIVKTEQESGQSDFDNDNAVNASSIAAMRTSLTAANGTLYTTKYLDSLNANDLLYCYRLEAAV